MSSFRPRIEPGRIQIGDENGIAWLYPADGPGIDHLVFHAETLCEVGSPNAGATATRLPLYDQGGAEIGFVRYLCYHPSSRMLGAHFVVPRAVAQRLREDNGLYHRVAVAKVAVEEIGCTTCGRFFRERHIPCECITTANMLLAKKLCVRSVRFCDDRYEDVFSVGANTVDILRRQFFGGTASALHVSVAPPTLRP